MAAHGHDSAARAADVAQQQLEDGGGPDDLHADRLLRPADRIAERGGALPARVLDQRLGDLVELRLGDPADLRHHLRRVAREVLAQELEDAALVLQRLVAVIWTLEQADAGVLVERLGRMLADAGGSRDLAALVHPAPRVIRAGLGVKAGEDATEIFGVGELLVDDRRRVGVVQDVFLEVGLRLEDMADDPAQERDVGSGADGNVDVGRGASAPEARIDVDDLRAALPRAHDPAEPHRVRLGHIGALDEDAV